jgi:hypothetical protein
MAPSTAARRYLPADATVIVQLEWHFAGFASLCDD